MRNRFGYSAAWLPTTALKPGDVGRLVNYEYQPIASLADFGIAVAQADSRGQASLSYSSANSVRLDIKLAGSIPPPGSTLTQAEAGAQLSFGSANATFFQAEGCRTHALSNIRNLELALATLAQNGTWERDFVVITEVIRASSATIVISSSAQAMIELRASATFGTGTASLADASAGLKVGRSRDIGTQIIAECELTPLFKAYGLKRRLLRRPKLAQRSTTFTRTAPPLEDEPMGDVVFGEVDYSDF